jgi:FkbM family methyltransferase
MSHALDKKLSDGRNVADVVFAPLLAANIAPVVIDVGARNGMHATSIPNSYASRSVIVGFEPNLEEYEKLIGHKTDAQQSGAPMSRFKREEYFQCALWDKDEQRPFYITNGAGACTLMGQTSAAIGNRMWLDGDDRSYSEVHTDVRKITQVECKRLDKVISVDQQVDILKLDVEGGEFAVLNGAMELLKRKNILFIKSEFLLTPYYDQCPVLGHQHVLLHDHGFRLIDMDFDHVPYSRSKPSIPASVDRRMVYGGDAYFLLDPDRHALDPLTTHRLGVACLVFNFSTLATSLFRDAALLSDREIEAIEAAISKNWTSKRLRHIWAQIPRQIKNRFS